MLETMLFVATILLVCSLLKKVSGKIGIPSLLLFIILGMLVGSDGIFRIPFDDYYWLTVRIINDNIEDSYFDVTSKNHFDDLDDPWFEDLYLDIIIPYKEKPILVDEDELLKAYEDGLIDKGAYDKAYKVAHKIIDTYLEDQDSYYDHLYHYYHLLKDDD